MTHPSLSLRSSVRLLLLPLLSIVHAGAHAEGQAGTTSALDVAQLAPSVARAYAELVHERYAQSLESARALRDAVRAFVAGPSRQTLDAARGAWTLARGDFGRTEVFRFYQGPIDDPRTGVEVLLNAWPVDEAYIDAVEGAPGSGIINNPERYPTLEKALLEVLNQRGGETNVCTGWHALEFMLWGQDLRLDGPGDRSPSDFDPRACESAQRRAEFLAQVTDLLVVHLEQLVGAWAPDRENYRARFLAEPPLVAVNRMLTG